MDPRLLSEAGGDILLVKIPSPHKKVQLTFEPGMFTGIKQRFPAGGQQPPPGEPPGPGRESCKRRLLPLMRARTSGGSRSPGLQRHVDPDEPVPQVPLGVDYRGYQAMDWGDCQGRTMASSSPPPFRKLRIGLVKASGRCPSY